MNTVQSNSTATKVLVLPAFGTYQIVGRLMQHHFINMEWWQCGL